MEENYRQQSAYLAQALGPAFEAALAQSPMPQPSVPPVPYMDPNYLSASKSADAQAILQYRHARGP